MTVVKRISRSFKDISLSFSPHPVTKDLPILKNESAIKRSVTNLVRTRIGERFYNPLLGSSIEDSLFEQADPDNALVLEDDIQLLLDNFEPRIKNTDISVIYPLDTNELTVVIKYDVVGLPFPRQNIEFILQSTRI